jgi:hypothetical protein
MVQACKNIEELRLIGYTNFKKKKNWKIRTGRNMCWILAVKISLIFNWSYKSIWYHQSCGWSYIGDEMLKIRLHHTNFIKNMDFYKFDTDNLVVAYTSDCTMTVNTFWHLLWKNSTGADKYCMTWSHYAIKINFRNYTNSSRYPKICVVQPRLLFQNKYKHVSQCLEIYLLKII